MRQRMDDGVISDGQRGREFGTILRKTTHVSSCRTLLVVFASPDTQGLAVEEVATATGAKMETAHEPRPWDQETDGARVMEVI